MASSIKSDSKKGTTMEVVDTKSLASSSRGIDIPDIFLYTTLNQNQTKDLRKANTNKEERKVLANIFKLNAIKQSPGEQINKVDQLILDFHAINYDFCVQNAYSNEKISTLLAIMDFILHTMIKKQLQPEAGVKMLKEILARHQSQRPPYSIFIFSEKECTIIINFMLRTFFRHFCLYEYSFKPKVDLILMTIPGDIGGNSKNGSKLTENSQMEANSMNK